MLGDAVSSYHLIFVRIHFLHHLELYKCLQSHFQKANLYQYVLKLYKNWTIFRKTWLSKSYPSLKKLGSYVKDLRERIDFFKDWMDNGMPATYVINKFFSIHCFLSIFFIISGDTWCLNSGASIWWWCLNFMIVTKLGTKKA